MDRRRVRYLGAAAAAAMAAIYYLIGIGVLEVVEPGTTTGDAAPDMLVFGGGAGTLFLIGAVLLFGTDRRILWVGGAILQVLVAAMYVAVSPSRTPPFELWGVTLRLLQVPLLAALLYLAWHAPRARGSEAVPQDRR